MSLSQCVLFPQDTGWRVAVVDDTVSFVNAESEADVANLLLRQGKSKRVWIALPSNKCLCAAISTSGLPNRRTIDALKYRLEEVFPWSAEDFVIGTSALSNGEVFTVATRERELNERIAALTKVGIVVAGVSPAALLAASNVADEKTDAILLQDDTPGWINLIRLRNGVPSTWDLIGSDSSQIQTRLMSVDTVPVQPDGSMATLAATEAARILTRLSRPMINLIGVPAARPIGILCAVACGAILFGLCSGFIWRTSFYNREAVRSDEAARAIFTHVFPATPIPAGVVSRLVGQARAMRAAAGGAGDIPQQAKSLSPTLSLVLNSLGTLPLTIRFTIDDLVLDMRHLSITGQAASVGDAQNIADALHSLNGWTVDPPHTEQRLAAVDFAVQATADLAPHQTIASREVVP